ncbi:TolC family outer membrane protein [Actimicrobium sp. CCI2.3]|uniref:TolC family outer membrane protein n=2 Tax=Bacteria TaxID=2 RepID=UPI002AB411AE|nr:TolC family outer membrane protein [Actimicrobium sp. CCI2.3]MDY7576106.1 TolC family outer membrane protein [Actimicrobium sp. CCI2.3]MEB0023036.1 TolC family outer membrane protein [Actimicrobium sp. CCI2.3]
MRYFVIVPLLACALLSAPAQATDLLQVYRDALINDAVIASARSAREAGQERSVQGRAGLLPVLGIGGSYNRINAEASARNIDYNVNTYALTLTQPLLRMANWETYQQGVLSVAISDAVYAQAQQDLIARVAQAYFDVLAAQDVLAFLKAQEDAISEQLASAKRNFEVGTATITDSNEAQARYDLAIAQQIAAQNDLDVKTAALQQIIGKPTGVLATLRPGIKLSPPEPAQIDPWVRSAEEQNFGVIGQQLTLEIARREISRSRAGHLPTLDLIASRGTTNQSSPSLTAQSGSVTSSTIGVQWQIPLYSGFAITSKVRESIALEDKARSDLENFRRTAAQAARQSYFGVNSGLAQVRAYEAAEVSSLSALESNRLGYQVGVRINIDVLNAQQQLFSTRQLLAKARYDTLIAGLRLKAAAGTLKEDDLALVNGLLQN